MNRRDFLTLAGFGYPFLAGCTGGSNSEIRDSDGDGMIDSKDYAPKDPDVQKKSDILSSEIPDTPADQRSSSTNQDPTSTPTQTNSPTSTPTTTSTPTPTPTQSPTPAISVQTVTESDTDGIEVDDEYWKNTSRIEYYSAEEVSLVIEPDYPEADFDSSKIYVGAFEYPRVSVVDEATSHSFDRSDGTQEFVITMDLESAPIGERLHYFAALLPSDSTIDTASSENVKSVMETDPFVITTDNTIEKSPHPAELEDDQGNGYSRNSVEGSYSITVSGRTYGQGWEVNFAPFKSAYIQAINRSRGRSRSEYVAYELTQGTAVELAHLLQKEAEDNGITDKVGQVEFIIDFVQRLPYVPDDVSKGFDDYTKFIMETIVELSGDCEDTSILLASMLEAEPFGYDMILIQPPGHMGAGIWQSDPRGCYWELDERKYSYIETTGEGWGIGDCPEDYQDVRAYLHQV